MTNFQWNDPFNFEQQLSTEEKQISETTRKFAENYLSPRVRKDWREEVVDKSIFNEMGKLGLLGSTISEEYGGGSLSHIAHFLR